MVEFKWEAALAIGHEVVDSQHHVMLDLLNQLQHAASETESIALLLSSFRQLESYTLQHFEAEETIMREIGFEFYEAHLAEHEKMRQQVAEFHAAVRNEEGNPREVVSDFATWLLTHICGCDSLIGESIRRKQSGTVLAH